MVKIGFLFFFLASFIVICSANNKICNKTLLIACPFERLKHYKIVFNNDKNYKNENLLSRYVKTIYKNNPLTWYTAVKYVLNANHIKINEYKCNLKIKVSKNSIDDYEKQIFVEDYIINSIIPKTCSNYNDNDNDDIIIKILKIKSFEFNNNIMNLNSSLNNNDIEDDNYYDDDNDNKIDDESVGKYFFNEFIDDKYKIKYNNMNNSNNYNNTKPPNIFYINKILSIAKYSEHLTNDEFEKKIYKVVN